MIKKSIILFVLISLFNADYIIDENVEFLNYTFLDFYYCETLDNGINKTIHVHNGTELMLELVYLTTKEIRELDVDVKNQDVVYVWLYGKPYVSYLIVDKLNGDELIFDETEIKLLNPKKLTANQIDIISIH
jgi:hypothetical protein